MKFAEAAVLINNNMSGLAAIAEREPHPIFKMFALFWNYEGESVGTMTDDLMAEKMADFDASGIDPSQLVVISFNAEVIRDVEKARPELKTYYLCSPKHANIEKLIRLARVIGTDGINGSASKEFDESVIAQIRAAGLAVYVWTIDDEKTIRRYADLGVDGITTNKPGFAKSVLASQRKQQ